MVFNQVNTVNMINNLELQSQYYTYVTLHISLPGEIEMANNSALVLRNAVTRFGGSIYN